MFINFNLNQDVFKEEFLYKKPYLFKSVVDNTGYTWNDVNELYNRSNISDRDFKIMDGYDVPKQEYIVSYENLGVIEHKCITSVLYRYLRNGATLVRNRIKNEPIVDSISKQIANYSEARTITGSYAAFSSKSSYKSHWDTRDVYAVQLLGRKRWIIKAPNFEFPLYMQQSKDMPDINEPEDIYMDVTLEPGDILYIPRGWWHDPIPLGEETFHLAVASFPPTAFEYIEWVKNISPSIIDFRKNLSGFEKDTEIIYNISNKITEIIQDKNYYQKFMIHYLSEQYVSSGFSLDILGNNKVTKLKKSQKFYLNTNLLYFFEDGFIILNGSVINIDEISLKLIQHLFKNPYISLEQITNHFNSYNEDKINELLFNLAIEDVVELVL